MKKEIIIILCLLLYTQVVSQNVFEENLDIHLLNTRNSTLNPEQLKIFNKNKINLSSPYKIPKKYHDTFQIETTEKPIKTLHNKYIIRGFNKEISQVLIQNTKIPVNSYGNFYYELTLKHPETYHIPITFITKYNKHFTVYRTIQKLKTPLNLEQYKHEKKNIVNFYNSPLAIPDKNNLNEPITRAEFAYFLYILTNHTPISNSKITNDFWATPYITHAIKNKWMNTFPDNTFYPHKALTKLDYLISILKITSHPTKQTEEWSKDWISNIINTGQKNKLVTTISKDTINQTMNWAELVQETKHYPDMQQTLRQTTIKKLTEVPPLPIKIKTRIATLLQKNTFNKENPELYLDKFKDINITYTPQYPLNGQIYPPSEVNINYQVIPVDKQGFFSTNLNLKNGKNTISISTKKETTNFNIFLIPIPEDIQHHWIKDAASKLIFSGIINVQDQFQPKSHVKREDLANLLYSIFQENIERTEPNSKENTDDKEENNITTYSTQINKILNKNIMSLDENNQFNPDKTLTRAEALSAVIRASNIPLQTNDTQNHYWDIHSTHWVAPYIKTAINHNIISTKQQHFYPNRLINKAELHALISKIPAIQEKINTIFK